SCLFLCESIHESRRDPWSNWTKQLVLPRAVFGIRDIALGPKACSSFLSSLKKLAGLNSLRTPTVLMSSLSGVGSGSDNFPFHFVFFPAASFLSFGGCSVVVVVTWVTAIDRGVVNLLPYPSLRCGD